jgi:hypothetical protein
MAITNPNSIFAGTSPDQKLPNVFTPLASTLLGPLDDTTPRPLEKAFAPKPNDAQPTSQIARTLQGSSDQAPVLQRVNLGGQSEPLSTIVPDRPQGQIAKVLYAPPPDQQQLDTLRAKRQSLYDTDARPYGFGGAPPSPEHPGGLAPNHPGKWGHALHALSVAGQIAGDIFAPNIMAEIPGTQLNRQVQEQGYSNEINREQQLMSENQERDAQTQGKQIDNANAPQREADQHALNLSQQGNLDSETYARQHPQPQNEFQLWRQQNPNGTAEQFNALQSHPLSQADADSRNAVWNTIATKYHLPQNQFRAGMSGADATQLAAAMNNVIGRDQGGTKITIEGQKAEQAGNKTRDANTEKAYNAAFKDLNSQFSGAQTQAETLATAREELNSGAVGQAAGTIKTLVGLAGGKGTGVRITQAELNAIAHARGIAGDFEGWVNKMSGEGQLSHDQLAQMNSILSDVEGKLRQKMGMQDQYLDKLSSAGSEQEIRQIQSQYRKEFLNPSGNAGAALNGKVVSLKQAMGLPQFQGKSADEVRKEAESRGYKVSE